MQHGQPPNKRLKLTGPAFRRIALTLGVATGMLPNMRLKLAGGDRSKGNGVLCAGAHELSFTYTALGGRVARSLSASVRQHPRPQTASRSPCARPPPIFRPTERPCHHILA